METNLYKLTEIFKKAPKPQLHLHLDGSLPGQFIVERYNKYFDKLQIKFDEKINNEIDLRTQFMKMKQKQFQSKSEVGKQQNWPVFDFCNQFLQTQEDLQEATRQIVDKLFTNNYVNLVEIRFAPILHTQQGLNQDEVITSVIKGFQQAQQQIKEIQKQDIHGGVILCALRSFDEQHSLDTIKLVEKYYQKGVIGFDLAGDEGSYPLKIHEKAFQYAKEKNLNATCHAGEWNESYKTIQNIQLAVELGCKRIGHGLTLRSEMESAIVKEIREKNIGIEVCLTSNCGNPSKCVWYDQHPLKQFFEKNLSIAALNCDNTMLSGSQQTGRPTPDTEVARAYLDCGIPIEKIIDNAILNGYRQSFDQSVSEEFILNSISIWKQTIIPLIKEFEQME